MMPPARHAPHSPANGHDSDHAPPLPHHQSLLTDVGPIKSKKMVMSVHSPDTRSANLTRTSMGSIHARAVAKAAADMKAPDGIMIGVNGMWGDASICRHPQLSIF
jgi:hypothetical protein